MVATRPGLKTIAPAALTACLLSFAHLNLAERHGIRLGLKRSQKLTFDPALKDERVKRLMTIGGALALRRVSSAWRSFRFSRSSCFRRSRSSVVEPGLRPWSRLGLVHSSAQCLAVHPLFAEIEAIALQGVIGTMLAHHPDGAFGHLK